MGRYAAQLSQVSDVSSVSAPDGTFVGGSVVGPPSAATGVTDGSAFLTVDEQRAAVLAGLRRRSSTNCRRCPVPQDGSASDRDGPDQPRHRRRRHLPAAARPGRHCRRSHSFCCSC